MIPFFSYHNLLFHSTELLESDDDDDADAEKDEKGFENIEFMKFVNIINEMFDKTRRLLITAGGGYGKTTASKRLALHWSENECLQKCLLFIRLDLKNVKSNQDLYSAFLEQFPQVGRQFSKEDLIVLKSVFEIKQEQIFFALDGLDESKSKSLATNEFNPTDSEYPKSFVMILSRPEAKKYLDISSTEVTEFEITRLSKDQYLKFALDFPFAEGKKEQGQQLIKKCNQNPSFGKLMEVPMTAVMNCSLFNDPRLSKDLKDQLDLFYCLIAMYIKSELLKQIDLKLSETSLEEVEQQLLLEKDETLRLDVEEIFSKFKQELVALGRAIFECNGKSLVGFNDCNRKSLETSLASQGLDRKEVDFVLRLSFMEEIIDEESMVPVASFRFLHRDIREFLVSIFATFNGKELPTQSINEDLKEGHLSIFRCILANHVKQKSTVEELKENLQPLINHILSHINHNPISNHKAAQMICELTHLHVSCQQIEEKKFLSSLISQLKVPIADKLPKFSKKMNVHYLNCLTSHFKKKESCKSCKMSEGLSEKSPFSTSRETQYVHQWPQQHPLRIFPFLNQGRQSIRFLFPSSKFGIQREHATEDSFSVLFKVKHKMSKGEMAEIVFRFYFQWRHYINIGACKYFDLSCSMTVIINLLQCLVKFQKIILGWLVGNKVLL